MIYRSPHLDALAPAQDASTFRTRLEAAIAAIRADPEVVLVEAHLGDPADPSTLRTLQQELGYEVDGRFLDYFRSVNGVRLRWALKTDAADPWAAALNGFTRYGYGLAESEAGGPLLEETRTFGHILLAPIEQILTRAAPDNFDSTAEFNPVFAELRYFDQLEQDHSDPVAVRFGPNHPDPVAYLITDQGCCPMDNNTMVARHYLDMVVASLGAPDRSEFLLRSFGAEGEWPTLDTAGWFAPWSEPAVVLQMYKGVATPEVMRLKAARTQRIDWVREINTHFRSQRKRGG